MAKQGVLITNSVILKEHEMMTVVFFLERGYSIELIPPSLKCGTKSADLIMGGEVWEMKSPAGKGKYLMRDTLKCAIKQSPNIIVDLRRVKMNSEKALNELRKYYVKHKAVRRLIVVLKNNESIEFSRTK